MAGLMAAAMVAAASAAVQVRPSPIARPTMPEIASRSLPAACAPRWGASRHPWIVMGCPNLHHPLLHKHKHKHKQARVTTQAITMKAPHPAFRTRSKQPTVSSPLRLPRASPPPSTPAPPAPSPFFLPVCPHRRRLPTTVPSSCRTTRSWRAVAARCSTATPRTWPTGLPRTRRTMEDTSAVGRLPTPSLRGEIISARSQPTSPFLCQWGLSLWGGGWRYRWLM